MALYKGAIPPGVTIFDPKLAEPWPTFEGVTINVSRLLVKTGYGASRSECDRFIKDPNHRICIKTLGLTQWGYPGSEWYYLPSGQFQVLVPVEQDLVLKLPVKNYNSWRFQHFQVTLEGEIVLKERA